MNQLRASLSIRGALLLAALSGLLSVLPARAQDDARRAAPPPGKALVFVFRNDRVALPAKVPAVVNMERLGELANGTFVTATVNPGPTNVRIGDRALTTVDFMARANQRYFVRVDATYGVTIVRTEVRLVDELEGSRALEQSRFVGNVAPAVAAAPRPQQPSVPAPQAIAPVPPVTRTAPVPPPRAAAPVPPPRAATPEAEVSAPAESGSASRIGLIVSTGAFNLSNGSQVIGGLQSTYDTASKSVLNLQVEWRDKTNMAIGGEIFSYENDVATTGGAPDAKQKTLALMANAKYYFRATSWAYPFVGAGIGYTSSTYSGNLTGTATGLAYQGLAGAEFRFKNFGLYLQYKALISTAGDAEKVKVGGSGILAGVSFIY